MGLRPSRQSCRLGLGEFDGKLANVVGDVMWPSRTFCNTSTRRSSVCDKVTRSCFIGDIFTDEF